MVSFFFVGVDCLFFPLLSSLLSLSLLFNSLVADVKQGGGPLCLLFFLIQLGAAVALDWLLLLLLRGRPRRRRRHGSRVFGGFFQCRFFRRCCCRCCISSAASTSSSSAAAFDHRSALALRTRGAQYSLVRKDRYREKKTACKKERKERTSKKGEPARLCRRRCRRRRRFFFPRSLPPRRRPFFLLVQEREQKSKLSTLQVKTQKLTPRFMLRTRSTENIIS